MNTNKQLTEDESVDKFNTAKESTIKNEACAKLNYQKFTALQATNCGYAQVPQQVTVRLIQDLFKDASINEDIKTIVERSYNKVSQKIKREIPQVAREYQQFPQDPVVQHLIDTTGTKYSIREIEHSFRKIYLERLPSLGYNDTFIKKMIIFYAGLQAEGPFDDIQVQSTKQVLSLNDLQEITDTLTRLKLLEINGPRYTKRNKRAQY